MSSTQAIEVNQPSNIANPSLDVPNQLEPLKGGALVLLTIATAMVTFMEVLDTTIANVAVPTIAGTMGVSANEGTSIISSYSLAAAIAVPLTGWRVAWAKCA